MEYSRNAHSEEDISEIPKAAILVIMGLPGSGKTTLCSMLPHFLGDNYRIVHVCYDKVVSFCEKWSDGGSHGMWKKERMEVLLAAEGLVKNILFGHGISCLENSAIEAEKSKLTTPLDQTCLSKEPKLDYEEDILLKKLFAEEIYKLSKVDHENDVFNFRDRKAIEDKDISNKTFKSNDDFSASYFSSLDIPSVFPEFQGLDFAERDQIKNKIILLCVDDNFYYHSMRKEWWNLAAKYELPFCTLVLNCDVDTCIKRVRERVQLHPEAQNVHVPVEVIQRMSKRMELPDVKLYPWEKYCIVLDSGNLKITVPEKRPIVDEAFFLAVNHIKEVIHTSMQDPAKPLKTEENSISVIAMPSFIHRVDLVLRQIVGKSDVSLKAKINKKRKTILEDLRNGRIFVPKDMIDEENEGSSERLEKYVATLIDISS